MYNKKDAMNGVSTKFQDRFRVKSTRLKYWDYNSCGGYFVTICVKEYTCMFGNIENGQMVLSELGKEAKKFWDQIPKHFSHAHMDEYVFMPNHMHGIIMIEPVRRDAIYGVSIQESKPKNGGIVDLKHNWALPYCNRGVLYDNQGNFNQALSDFAKAIELNPNMAEAYYNRSALYFDQGNFIYALMDLNKTIELNPNMAEAYNNRGAIYFKDKNLIKAVSDFSKAIELEPNDEEAYCNRGDVNLRQGNLTQALIDENKAIGLDPKYIMAYQYRSRIYFVLKKYNDSWSDVHKVEQLGGAIDPNFLNDLKNDSRRDQ